MITLPSLQIDGVVSCSPYIELNKTNSIVSTSGYVTTINYSGRGWVSGKKNSFSATICHKDDPKKILYTAEGQWTNGFEIRNSAKQAVDVHDPDGLELMPPTVKPIEEQGEWESRRKWAKVAEAIRNGDMEATQREKSIVENEQREMRRKEKEEGRVWERKYFQCVDCDELFDRLAAVIGEEDEAEKTGGVWMWNTQEQHLEDG